MGGLAFGNVRDGPLIFNTTRPQVDAALAGLGIALLPEDELIPHIEAGRLVRVLEDWCPKFDGYHLYYPSRRQPSPAFALVVQMLRGRGASDDVVSYPPGLFQFLPPAPFILLTTHISAQQKTKAHHFFLQRQNQRITLATDWHMHTILIPIT